MNALENFCLEIRRLRSKPIVVVTWNRPLDTPIGIFSPFESLSGKLISENVVYFATGDLSGNMTSTRFDSNRWVLLMFTDSSDSSQGRQGSDLKPTSLDTK